MRRFCAFLVLLVLMVTCLSAYAEDNEVQGISLFIYGYSDTDALNSYLENVRINKFPDLKSINQIQIIPDEYGLIQLTVYIKVPEYGVYILPRDVFNSIANDGDLMPLEYDEELINSVSGNNSIENGWRSAGNEMHLYGIPLDALPGANQYLYVEDGFICAVAGEYSPEKVMTFLRILCQDPQMQTEQSPDEEASTFSFRNGITFGMNENEVKQMEEANNQILQDYWASAELSSWCVIHSGSKIKVSTCEGTLMYFFTNEQMEAAFYDIHSDDGSEFKTITAALSKVYGESEPAESASIVKLMDCFNPGYYTESDISSPLAWSLANVCIYQFYYDSDDFVVCYINPNWNYQNSITEENEAVDTTGI